MQKHERLCLEAAIEILKPNGFKVWADNHSVKLAIWAEGHGIKDRKTVASSPRSCQVDQDRTKQWARRLVKRLKEI